MIQAIGNMGTQEESIAMLKRLLDDQEVRLNEHRLTGENLPVLARSIVHARVILLRVERNENVTVDEMEELYRIAAGHEG